MAALAVRFSSWYLGDRLQNYFIIKESRITLNPGCNSINLPQFLLICWTGNGDALDQGLY